MRLGWKYAPFCLLSLLLWLALPPAIHAQEPDFSDTPDILHGATNLLRDDDVVVAAGVQTAGPPVNYLVSTSYLLTQDSSISQTPTYNNGQTMQGLLPDPTAYAAAGRMYDWLNDVAVTVAIANGPTPDQAFVLAATFYNRQTLDIFSQSIVTASTPGPVTPQSVVMADFTGDGFDDLAVSFGEESGQTLIVQPVDVEDWTAGFVVGPALASAQALQSLAAADVDGDGRRQLLGVTSGSGGSTASLVVLSADPTTLALTQQSSTPLSVDGALNRIVSGDYDDNPEDDEAAVVSSAAVTTTGPVSVQLYSFIGNPPVATLLDTATLAVTGVDVLAAAGGNVHWFGSGGDAIVVGVAAPDGSQSVSILTVEVDQLQLQSSTPLADNTVFAALGLGRFDNLTSSGAVDPDLQLVVIGEVPDNSQTALATIYDIGANGAGYTLTQTSGVPAVIVAGYTPTAAVGDLQGRSQRLGAPNKIIVNGHSAPRTAVGMPPMHLDWVVPSCSDPQYLNNCTTPQQVQILAKPASNYAQMNTEVKNSSQSSSKHTTSYSFSTKEEASAKVSFGIPFIDSISVAIKDAAKQTYDTSVATAQNSYSSVAFDASVRTGFADHIWFDNYRFNIWTYPVTGQTVCPQSIPNCSADQMLPLQMQFSGPDRIDSYDLDGNLVEWYQPVWEPGNVLSYPWTQAQLLATLPRSTVVNASDVWAADSSGANASVTWSQGGGQSVSQGGTNTYSNDASISVSAGGSIEGFGISGSASFDVSKSKATQTLNTSSDVHGSSTGFNVAKTDQGVADYVFAAQTYILGQTPITGTLQNLPLTTTVQTSGPLRLAYWANPFDSVVGGAWWPTAYALPDVALNHPQRWTWTTTPEKPNIMTFNDVVTSTSPFDQEFYFMRGLYVTPADAPDGSQVVSVPVSQTLLLQARVYNYSHVDMNAPGLAQPAAAVKVRFYGQLFQSEAGEYPVGGSFLIGEQTLAPIPGFASATTPGDVPNWSMALQPFNAADFAPTQQGGVYLRFWVVVWMEDSGGHLVPEMAGHGLTANPAQSTINTLGDVRVEPYSNNAGTFKQVIYIQDPTAPPPLLAAGAAPTVTVIALPLTGATGAPFGKQIVTVTVQGGAAPLASLQLLYYDGDPAQGGRLFDWELVPYVAAGAPYVNRVVYTPQACGAQQIYVVAKGAGIEATQSLAAASTPCWAILPFIGKQ